MKLEKRNKGDETIEVTKEFFYNIVKNNDKTIEVVNKRDYKEVYYFKHGVKLFYISNFISGINYYIEDINK